MFTVKTETCFSALHQIKFANGTAENLHEHLWNVEVAVNCENLDKNGLGIDFHILKDKTDKILSVLHNKKLENTDFFQNINASAENVAKYIYQRLETTLPKNVQLQYVEVTEEPGCKVRYEEK